MRGAHPLLGLSIASITCLSLLLTSQHANAWFFFLPLGAIARALEKDPDSFSVSAQDRLVGKCFGYHSNQTMGGSKTAEEMSFHQNTAQLALEKAAQKETVRELGNAYSAKWGRAAEVDRNTNLAYGRDLAAGCTSLSVPISLAIYHANEQVKREEERARLAEDAAKRAKAATDREEENKRQAEKVAAPSSDVQPTPVAQLDFNFEARKAARILGCKTTDPKAIGAENNNIVFAMTCEEGGALTVSCDPTGLCLKK